MKTTKKLALLFLGALALQAQTVSLSDTLTNAVGGGNFTGRVTVTLNAPGNASPLYYSTTSLTGWQATYCLGVTGADCTTTANAGVFAATLYANSTITPAGTSYAARFQPTKGSPWSETWVVTPSTTTLRQVRATTVPTPTTTFQPSQISAGGASNGNCLVFDGTVWEPGACASGGGSGTVTSVAATVPSILSVAGSPITSSGTLALSLATQTANQVFAGPTTGAAATPTFRTLVDADIPNAITIDLAATATALATPRAINGTNFDGTAAITITANLPANPTACASGEYVSDIAADGTLTCSTPAGGGSGTVTSVSVATANGVSGSVANATTTPAITLTLGAITPTSVAASGNVTGANLSGTNTGDQTTITGNAGTATALAANGANCAAGEFPLGVDASGASETCTALPTTIAGTLNQITASAATGTVTLSIPTNPTLPGTTTGTFSGNLTGNVTGTASSATALAANPTDCAANNFATTIDASGNLTCGQPSISAGVSGLGTGVATALATPSSANLRTAVTDETGTGSLVFATSPTLVTPALGTPSAIVLTNATGTAASLTAGAATALAANGANCSAGQFPLGVSAAGAAESCTALPTTITGTANEITASASTGAITLSLPSTVSFAAKTLRVPNSTTLPATCTVGDSYMDTDATSGSRWFLCEATNTWVVQGASSTGTTVRTAYASLPTCDSTKTNYLYLLTDSIYTAHCNGTAFAYWSGPKYIPTLPWSNGTAFGSGATVTATTGSVLFDGGSPTGGDSIRASIKAVPTAPYTIILDVDISQAGTVSSSCGLVLTDGTVAASNKVITLMQSHVGLNMTKLTNATTWNSNYIAYAQAVGRGKISFRLVDDNTNRTWSISPDRINWTQVSQQGRTDFLTATHYGYGCNLTGVSGIVTMVIEGLYAQ